MADSQHDADQHLLAAFALFPLLSLPFGDGRFVGPVVVFIFDFGDGEAVLALGAFRFLADLGRAADDDFRIALRAVELEFDVGHGCLRAASETRWHEPDGC